MAKAGTLRGARELPAGERGVYHRLMLAPTLLAAAAAVLAGGQISLVSVPEGRVTATVALPGTGAALFSAPDGSLVVPLASSDETVVIGPNGDLQRWPGRVFPLFFDEFDRMYVVMPEKLVCLAFPQRAEISRVLLPGTAGAYRAVVSSDGLAVALLAAPPARRELVVVVPRGESHVEKTSLGCEPLALTMDPAGGWVLTGCRDGGLEMMAGGETPARGSTRLDGEIVDLAPAPDGRSALAAVAGDGRAWLAGVRVKPRSRRPLKETFTTALPWLPVALAVRDDEVLVAGEGGVVLLRHGGRKITGQIALPGARAVAFLPEAPVSGEAP
jgi:hypothetical protein